MLAFFPGILLRQFLSLRLSIAGRTLQPFRQIGAVQPVRPIQPVWPTAFALRPVRRPQARSLPGNRNKHGPPVPSGARNLCLASVSSRHRLSGSYPRDRLESLSIGIFLSYEDRAIFDIRYICRIFAPPMTGRDLRCMPKDSCSFRFSVEEDGNAAVWILGCAVLTQSAIRAFFRAWKRPRCVRCPVWVDSAAG